MPLKITKTAATPPETPMPPPPTTKAAKAPKAPRGDKQAKILAKRPHGPRHPWADIFDTWSMSHVEEKPLTLREVADRFKVPYQTVLNYSHLNDWQERVKVRVKNHTEFLSQKIKENSAAAIAGVQATMITSEIEVRTKHALQAKMLQKKAVTRLSSIPIDELTPRDALYMLKIGMEEERKALGLPDVFVQANVDHHNHPEYRPLVQQFDNHRNVQALGLQLLKALKERQGRIENATNAEILEEVGLLGTTESDSGRSNQPDSTRQA